MPRPHDDRQRRRHPLDPTDAAYLGTELVLAVQHLDEVDAPKLRRALRTLWADPGIGVWVAAETAALIPVTTAERELWLDQVVVERPATAEVPATGIEDAESINPAGLGDLPFRFVVDGDLIVSRVQACLVDRWALLRLHAHVFAVCRGESMAWPAPWEHATRAERTVAATSAAAERPDASSRAEFKRRMLRGAAHEQSAAFETPASTGHVVVRTDAGFAARLRQLRDAAYPTASLLSVIAVGLRHGLGQNVGTPSAGLEVRYGARGEQWPALFGNATVQLALTPLNDDDPISVHRTISLARTSGLVDLAHLATRVRRGRQAPRPGVEASTGSPALVLDYFAPHSVVGELPGVGEHTDIALLESPSHADQVAFTVLERDGVMRISASFHTDTWRRVDVRRAVEDFVADPAELVSTTNALPR